MDEFLRQLLNRLDAVALENEEIYDSESRDRMSRAIMDGFVRGQGVDSLGDNYGLHSPEANQTVREVLVKYIKMCNQESSRRDLVRFDDRLAKFQDSKVKSDVEGNYYDEFFGHADSDWFDQNGQVTDGI